MILGAGLSGMAAGIKTGLPIYEATDHAGGICQSYNKDGFEFSKGGPHYLFGDNKGLDFIKKRLELKAYKRDFGVYYNHTFDFPIQSISQTSTKGSMKAWLGETFGEGLCNLFFYPYNEKYSCGLYDEIRPMDKFKNPKKGKENHIPVFYEPVEGIGSLVDSMASECDIHYNKRAVLIYPEDKHIILSSGETKRYDRLISTVPLIDLLHICNNFTFDLLYTSVLVINIGARRTKHTPDKQVLYVPFCKSGFYRIGISSNINPDKAPEGCVNLSVEIPLRHYEPIPNKTINKTIKELKSWRFIGQVLTVDPTYVRCAYTWDKNDDREKALEWLRSKGIESIGRYGKWKFQGMTQSIEDGLCLS